jgi:hypothetical protein
MAEHMARNEELIRYHRRMMTTNINHGMKLLIQANALLKKDVAEALPGYLMMKDCGNVTYENGVISAKIKVPTCYPPAAAILPPPRHRALSSEPVITFRHRIALI